MNARDKRLLTIKRIIETERIGSQEELLTKLKEQGVDITQSTLSRDIKTLHIAKLPDRDKSYIYVLSSAIIDDQSAGRTASLNIADNITELDFSGNICVVKTKPGYANAVTVLIDGKNFNEILGTVAGDDTILIVMREGITRQALIKSLSTVCHTLNYNK